MQRHVVWQRLDGLGLEHLELAMSASGVVADGLIIGVDGGFPFRVQYRIDCDRAWRVRRVSVTPADRSGGGLVLVSDGAGMWTGTDGIPLPVLDGCTDVDLSTSAFTNSIPVRRLLLEQGEAADVLVAYVRLPDFDVEAMEQRYTRTGADGMRYLFEAPWSGFAAELQVDGDGLVTEYPGLFRMAWPARGAAPEARGRA